MVPQFNLLPVWDYKLQLEHLLNKSECQSHPLKSYRTKLVWHNFSINVHKFICKSIITMIHV